MKHHPLPRPLPIRIDPLPDEAWNSYTARVAARLRVSVGDLYLDMPLVEPASLRRGQGLLTSERMIPHLAHRFRLSNDQVPAMFLNHYTAIPDCQPLEPPPSDIATRCGGSWQWLTSGKPRTCPDCRREQPALTRLSWHLRLCLICCEHRQFVTQTTVAARPTQEQVEWQQRVFREAQSPTPSEDGWLPRQLYKLWPLVYHAFAGGSASESVVRAAALTAWSSGREPIAATWLATDPMRHVYEYGIYHLGDQETAQELALLPNPIRQTIRLAYGGSPTPDEPVAQWYRMMPRSHYEPELSDLSWPVPDHLGRRAAALVGHAWLYQVPLRHISRGRHDRRIDAATSLLHRLTLEGRADRYRSLCARAAEDLGKNPTNPITPLPGDEEETLANHLQGFAPTASHTVLLDWIRSHWTNWCAPTTAAQRSAADELDRRLGDELRIIAAETLAEVHCRAS